MRKSSNVLEHAELNPSSKKERRSKIGSLEKSHKIESMKKKAPNPTRDAKFLANLSLDDTEDTLDDSSDEEPTDDYYVLEADISSTGGYITLMRDENIFIAVHCNSNSFAAFPFLLTSRSQKLSREETVTQLQYLPGMKRRNCMLLLQRCRNISKGWS